MERKLTKLSPLSIHSKIPQLKQVAAYVRVSSGKDTMLHSLSAQVSYYSDKIQKNRNWNYTGVYIDEAVTGTKDRRAGFQNMLNDCRSGKINMILTKSITRFARNTVTLLETIRELRLLSVDVFFEKENIHSISGDGELLLSILASYAQEESRSVSENCKWRLRKNFLEGKPNTFTVYGYNVHKGILDINKTEAPVVQRIFFDYIGGLGMTAISNQLNSEGVKTKGGAKWTPRKVSIVLRNEKYVGDLLMQKIYTPNHLDKKRKTNRGELPKYLVTDNHKAIISRTDFDNVQKIINERAEKYTSETPTTNHYQFTGKITCGICGKFYRRKQTNAGTKYQKIAWICTTFNTVGKSACSSKQIPESILEEITSRFNKEIHSITALPDNLIRFVFSDGITSEVRWENHSRRESWTDEMKQKARELTLQLNKLKGGIAQ